MRTLRTLQRRDAVAMAGVLAAALVCLPTQLRAQDPVAARMDASLRSALATRPADELLTVVVELDRPVAPLAGGDLVALRAEATTRLAPIEDGARRGEFELVERLWIVPAAVIEADSAALAGLATQPGVRRLYLDDRIPVRLEPALSISALAAFTSPAMQIVGADAVWPAGVTGEGLTVAFFDSGVDVDNAMVGSRWRGLRTPIRASWFDPFFRASRPGDRIGHGTQVALTAVGALAAGDTLLMPDGSSVVAASDIDVVSGTAPRAEWIAARIFDFFGGVPYTRRSVILQAFQWALDPDGNPGTDDAPDVINNSWGAIDAQNFNVCNDVIYAAIDAAEAAGIAVVFAAGNFGPTAGSVIPPAARDDPQLASFAVGATEGQGNSLMVADFSGRGPSPCNGGIKPDIVAPGRVPQIRTVNVNKAQVSGFTASGTSFSTGIVSGALALVRQVNPSATPRQAKEFLTNTAALVDPPQPNNNSGTGLLDVPAAVQAANPSFVGPLLQLESVTRESDAVRVWVSNRGNRTLRGVRLVMERAGRSVADGRLGRVDAGETRSLRMELESGAAVSGNGALRIIARDGSGAILLARSLLVDPPNLEGGFVLQAGGLEAGANDFGRLGQIAATRGFVVQGQDLLPAGAFFVASGGRISDGIYETVEGLPGLKTEPPAASTDWGPDRAATDVQGTEATFRFDDREALLPVGVSVDTRMEVTDVGGVAALEIVAVIRNDGTGTANDLTPGVFADWDLQGGEDVTWDAQNEALVAISRSGSGPVAVLGGEQLARGNVAVPLGTPDGFGVYVSGSGVLADGTFPDSIKAALAEGRPADNLPGAGTATDQGQLLSVGPLSVAAGATELVRFWLLVAPDQNDAFQRLTELRATSPVPPPTPAPGEGFVLLPPFPNPLTVGEGVMRFPFSIPQEARAAGARMTFEIYDVAGRRLVEERFSVSGSAPLPVPTWDGRLSGSRPAAAGVYLYVMRLDGENRSGRIMILR